jgi:hypothetical protein
VKRKIATALAALLLLGGVASPASAGTGISLDPSSTVIEVLVSQGARQGKMYSTSLTSSSLQAGVPLSLEVSSPDWSRAGLLQSEPLLNSTCELRFKIEERSFLGISVLREASLGSVSLSVTVTPHWSGDLLQRTIKFSGNGELGAIPAEYVGSLSGIVASLFCDGIAVLGKYGDGTYHFSMSFLQITAGPSTPKPPVVIPPVVIPKPPTIPKSTGSAKYLNIKYSNCTSLAKRFSGGIRKTSTTKNKGAALRITPYTSSVGYTKNKHLDRDKDGIACEK